MTVLWTEKTAQKATGGETHGGWQAMRVVIDSRKVEPGDLFVAIRGEQFDGHDFVNDAKNRGAVAALVDHAPANLAPQFPLLIVKDVLEGLRDLAAAARASFKGKVLAVTGSVGKTSAKEMLSTAFGALGKTYATSGNFNNHIGMPLTLANLPQDAAFAVLEMGMNHAGEITPLSRLARPHAAIITNVEAVHIEFFAGIEQIADAKAEIVAGMGQGSALLLPFDNAQYLRLRATTERAGALHLLSFGEKEGADFRLLDVAVDPLGTQVEAEISGTAITYRLGTYSRHWAVLSLAILGMVETLGEDLAKAAQALERFHELPGRGAVRPLMVDGKEILLIDDSYNASPVSMRQALRKLYEMHQLLGRKGRRIAVLGDMLELGPDGPMLHKSLAAAIMEWKTDLVFCAGPLMKELYDTLPEEKRGGWWQKASEMSDSLIASVKSGDTLVVKGSHGSGLYKIAEKIHSLGQQNEERERSNAL